jgi:5-formyltetrahydrofolate cyclo-ligase
MAVAFDFQVIAEIPVTEGDHAVDWVMTDRRVWKAASAGDAVLR